MSYHISIPMPKHKVVFTLKKSSVLLLPYAVEDTTVRIDSDIHVRNNYVVKMARLLVLKQSDCRTLSPQNNFLSDIEGVLEVKIPGRKCPASTLCLGRSLLNTSTGLQALF